MLTANRFATHNDTMAVESFLGRLRQLSIALPRPGCDWEERPRFDPPATLNSIAELERVAGFALPADFRKFLEQTNGVVAMSVHNGYWIGDVARLARSAIQSIFPSSAGSEPVIPIATDGGGNAFLLGSSSRIWRWNRETSDLTLIASSFDAFLERVTADWVAYIEETPGWRFLN